MNQAVEVLKFGSSVLRSPQDLHIALDEIYRRWRLGSRVLAVVSAFEGVTDELISDCSRTLGYSPPEALSAYVATGEQRTAALLLGRLKNSGIPSRLLDPRDIGLICNGPLQEGTPISLDLVALDRNWATSSVLVLPGYYGIDPAGRITLFGRGGSDLSAIYIAAQLNASCWLLKDVPGVFDADPASNSAAKRFSALTWDTAKEVAGPLIQKNALLYAESRAYDFKVGRPNDDAYTHVGPNRDSRASPAPAPRPLGITLVGCGIVGRGVYDAIKRYSEAFKIQHVLICQPERYSDIPERTTAWDALTADNVDVVILCTAHSELTFPQITKALEADKFVITANKAAVAAHGHELAQYLHGLLPRLWYSAAVGGALPVLETLNSVPSPVREIRAIINGTCGAVIDAWAAGCTRDEAVRSAQAAGYAEADPNRDLSGRDSAEKLVLMTAAAFGYWLAPTDIPTRGVDTIVGDPADFKLVARVTRTPFGIQTKVEPEKPPQESFLGRARGAENRVEIELENGQILRLSGQGAGRAPTTLSVLGDLHEIKRRIMTGRKHSPGATY